MTDEKNITTALDAQNEAALQAEARTRGKTRRLLISEGHLTRPVSGIDWVQGSPQPSDSTNEGEQK